MLYLLFMQTETEKELKYIKGTVVFDNVMFIFKNLNAITFKIENKQKKNIDNFF
jgi:hypothetical protein